MAGETLDEKLRKLGKDGIPGPSPGDESPSFAQEDLFRDAHKLLGDYLAEKFVVGGLGTFVEDFLRTAAPFVYYAGPGPDLKLDVGLVKSMDCAAFGEVSRKIVSESLAGTDFPYEGLSEAYVLGRNLYPASWIAAADAIPILKFLPKIEPYLLVMGMAPEHRALAALVAERGLQAGSMAADRKAFKRLRTSSGKRRADILSQWVPAPSDIEAVAGEYGRGDVPALTTSLLDEYARIIALYAREAT